MNDIGYSIGDVAALAHVSVRTLHHYDEIGLLSPSDRTAAGHRRYSTSDLDRLHQILVYRQLDFGLDAIAAMLADPGTGTDAHLRNQHAMLRNRMDRDRRLLAALENEMEARAMGMSLTPEEQFELFGTDKVGGEWHEEAEQRWGDTDAWRESQRRTAAYSKQDWEQLKAESDAGLRAYADAMASGVPADGSQAMELAEQNRLFICRWFYDCSHDMHRSLAAMYVGDERFRATYDAVAPGLAAYVHDAVIANAAAHGA
ncbi:MAG TPA: MerR family transcriptional regulator [Jatrophihabitantaceae bacterium]|nr:MerR family transcriptional regulator [Jatrophihabitantaceae bacterium]